MVAFRESKEIIRSAAVITSSALILATDHFIGPLNQQVGRSVHGREVIAAFLMYAKPVETLNHPLDTPEKRALMGGARFLTQSIETMVRILHGQTTIDTSVLIPVVIDLLINYSEYMTAFRAWRAHSIPQSYRRMQNALTVLREFYMRAQEEHEGVALLNDILRITNHMTTVEQEFPERVAPMMHNPPELLVNFNNDMNNDDENTNATNHQLDDNNLIPE